MLVGSWKPSWGLSLGHWQEPGGVFTSACALVRLGVEQARARCNEDSGRMETVQKKMSTFV